MSIYCKLRGFNIKQDREIIYSVFAISLPQRHICLFAIMPKINKISKKPQNYLTVMKNINTDDSP